MRELVNKIWPILIFLICWKAITFLFGIPTYILPAPEQVLIKLVDSRALLLKHGLISAMEIGLGFFAASAGGFLFGVLIMHSRRAEQIIEPFLVVSQVIPKVALAPLFIIWFGHGAEPKIIIAATIAFFPVLVNTVLGLKAVDREIIEMMNSIAASKRQMFLRVRLPNCLPYLLPSLKVAALLSVVGAMVGEFVGSDKGLGYLMILGDVNLDTELLFASLAVVTLMGLSLYGVVGMIERYVAQRYGSGTTQQMVTV